jgi:O-antigen biosynthesis protein
MAETAQWIGTSDDPVNGDWTDVSDWTNGSGGALGHVPGPDDAVEIQDGTVTFDTTDEIYSISGGVLDITGGSLTIDNTSTGTNTIDVGAGASLAAASGASIELTGTIDGTLAGAGGFVLDSGTTIGSDAELTASSITFNGAEVTGDLTYTGSGLTFDSGGVSNGATLTISAEDAAISNTGYISVEGTGSTLVLGADQSGTGDIYVYDSGTADIDNFAEGTVVFLDATGTLKLEQPSAFSGAITGLSEINASIHDSIDVVGQHVTGLYYAGTTSAGGDLEVLDGDTVIDNLNLVGNYVGQTFAFAPDASNTGYDIYIPCYRRGTRIQTARGETRIEQLAIGDLVMSLSGQLLPIRWIGHRSYSGLVAAGNQNVLPVLIRAGALADRLPRRDLWVSPEHAMCIDGMLIAARDLVNGDSIVQEQTVEEVSYFHLEFDTHAVIFAEGAPAESFVDDESREMFDNAAEYHQLYPQAVRQAARFCAPRVEEGHELEAVRQRLAARCRRSRRGGRKASLRVRNRSRDPLPA